MISLPISAEEVRQATERDSTLKSVVKLIRDGWPTNRKRVSPELLPYFDRRLQLSIQNGCILCGLKVVIPSVLREQVLNEIHEGHTGTVRMKSLTRIHAWWPTIDKEIENCVHGCDKCQKNSRNPTKAPVHPWERPLETSSFRLAGPFCSAM